MYNRLSLLIIADSEDLPQSIATTLSEHGLEPAYSVVSTPLDLAQALADEPWDIVVADPDQPGMPWIESLHITRTSREDTPFILVGETQDAATALDAIQHGADDYLTLSDWGVAAAFVRAHRTNTRRRNLARNLELHRQNEEKFRRVIEDSMVGIFRCTPWGRLTSFNPAFTRILGYTSPQDFKRVLEKARSSLHIDPDALETILTTVQQRNRIRDFETRVSRASGTRIWVSISARAVRGEAGELSAIEGSVENIDRRKKVEQMIIRAKQEWERTFDCLPDIITILDENFTIRRLNMAFAKRLGMHPRDIVGRHCSEFFQTSSGDDDWFMRLKSMAESGGDAEEMDIPQLGGVFLVTVSPFHVGKEISDIADGVVLVAHDISSRKQLEAKLRQSQKLEAIGTLAGGIAHDFNNILGVIMGYAEMALEDTEAASSAERRLTEILSAGRRARDLIHQILTFSRQEELALRPLSLDSVIKEVTKMLRASLPSNIDIRIDLVPDAGAVMANLSQIHQVLMNLCTNAAHAMRSKGGTLTVSLTKTTMQEADEREKTALCLSVNDTGHGIPQDILDNVFDPFFTTKQPDEGTGMGLAMVHGIVNSHGGFINVESSPGEGATFHVTLPVAEMSPKPDFAGTQVHVRGKGRAMFVDDEQSLAVIGGEMLESLGYTPVVETDSLRALETFKSAPDDFSLVITDQTMPSLSGEDLAGRMLAMRPDLPIIICTGYSEEMSAERARKMGVKGFLLKPVLKKDLAQSIRDAVKDRL